MLKFFYATASEWGENSSLRCGRKSVRYCSVWRAEIGKLCSLFMPSVTQHGIGQLFARLSFLSLIGCQVDTLFYHYFGIVMRCGIFLSIATRKLILRGCFENRWSHSVSIETTWKRKLCLPIGWLLSCTDRKNKFTQTVQARFFVTKLILARFFR